MLDKRTRKIQPKPDPPNAGTKLLGIDGQGETIALLRRPGSYPGAAEAAGEVVVIETHISCVFLVGSRAYKLKRAVAFLYLDFTSLQARKDACDAELRLNRRTASDLYLGLVPVLRGAGGQLALGHGNDAPVG
jgi:aminoglycoside phosphotransferase family enzyme